jgi:hypothetical protein
VEGYGFVTARCDQETGVIVEGRAHGMEAVLIGADDETVDAFLLIAWVLWDGRLLVDLG